MSANDGVPDERPGYRVERSRSPSLLGAGSFFAREHCRAGPPIGHQADAAAPGRGWVQSPAVDESVHRHAVPQRHGARLGVSKRRLGDRADLHLAGVGAAGSNPVVDAGHAWGSSGEHALGLPAGRLGCGVDGPFRQCKPRHAGRCARARSVVCRHCRIGRQPGTIGSAWPATPSLAPARIECAGTPRRHRPRRRQPVAARHSRPRRSDQPPPDANPAAGTGCRVQHPVSDCAGPGLSGHRAPPGFTGGHRSVQIGQGGGP